MDVIGNVKDEFVKPPNYSGPVMVGHLMFDADFESGNLGRIEYSADNEYDLFIRVDTCNQKYRLWARLNLGIVLIKVWSLYSSLQLTQPKKVLFLCLELLSRSNRYFSYLQFQVKKHLNKSAISKMNVQ